MQGTHEAGGGEEEKEVEQTPQISVGDSQHFSDLVQFLLGRRVVL